jgi:hypothetical protein
MPQKDPRSGSIFLDSDPLTPQHTYEALSTRRRPWKSVQALLADDDFREHCATMDEDPEEVLQVSTYTRAEKCSHPLMLARVNDVTGVATRVPTACNSNNADICAECAMFKRRLRTAQILDVLQRPNMSAALFTLTAPSFGRVHHATWTKKDEYAGSNLDPSDAYSRKLSLLHKRKPCPCKKHHDHDAEVIGTPLGKYDYQGEVIWSKNLPALVKSTTRALRRRAADLGLDKISLFTVYERQARGALHCHIIIAAADNPRPFGVLVDDIRDNWNSSNWKAPTAEIPSEMLAGLDIADAYAEQDPDLYGRLPKSKQQAWDAVPRINGKPATQFGTEYDIQRLGLDATTPQTPAEAATDEQDSYPHLLDDSELYGAENDADEQDFYPDLLDDLEPYGAENDADEPQEPDQEEEDTDEEEPLPVMPELSDFLRAAGYLSKYLAKNNSAFSPDAVANLHAPQRLHFQRFRRAALYLFGDLKIRDALIHAATKELNLVQDDRENVITQLAVTIINNSYWKERNLRKHPQQSGAVYRIAEPDPRTLDEQAVAAYEQILDDAASRLDQLRSAPLTATRAGSRLFAHLRTRTLTVADVNRFVEDMVELYAHEQDADLLSASGSYLKKALNRLADNGGFTGTLVSVHNWTTLSSMKLARTAWVIARAAPDEDAETFTWRMWKPETDEPTFTRPIPRQTHAPSRLREADDSSGLIPRGPGIWDPWVEDAQYLIDVGEPGKSARTKAPVVKPQANNHRSSLTKLFELEA